MLVERVLYRFDSVQHYSLSLNDLLAYVRPSLLERRKRYFEEEAKIFAGVIEEGVKAGGFRVAKPLETARNLLVATNSLLPYSLSVDELGDRNELKKRTLEIAVLVLDGLKK